MSDIFEITIDFDDEGVRPFEVEEFNPNALIVDVTRTCNETCAHCIVAASPRHKESISEEQMLLWIEDAINSGLNSIAFYWWEPFARRPLLYKWVEKTLEKGIPAQIMSNGFWGNNETRTNLVFDELEALTQRHDGIIQINLSTDEYHTRVPVEDLWNIISNWLERDDNSIRLWLSIWNWKLDQYDILEKILDQVEKNNPSIIPTWVIDHHQVWPCVRFVQKYVSIPFDINPDELKKILKENGIEVPDNITSTRDIYLWLHNSQLVHLIRTAEDEEKWEVQLWFYHPKWIHWAGWYDFKLLWAWEQLIQETDVVKTVTTYRNQASRTLRAHEREEILMLWMDGKFYISPAQLHYKISPLWENTWNAITNIIDQIRRWKHEVARIILEEDIDKLLQIYKDIHGESSVKFINIQRMLDQDLEYEVMYLILKDAQVQEILEKDNWLFNLP